jgi:nucleotide-binding universal stress UspA family protein
VGPGTAAFSASASAPARIPRPAVRGTLTGSTRNGEIVEGNVSGNETSEAGWPASAPPEPKIDLEPGRAVLERVLVGVDSTPESLEAARQADRLREQGGSIAMVTALELSTSAQAGWAASEAAVQLEADAQRALDAAKKVLPDATGRIVEGRADQVLVAEAESAEATLVAVGSHDISRAVGIALGSVATTLLHSAPCSVLVARGRPAREAFPRTIVVGVDGSPESELAAAVAFRLGERFGVEVWPLAARGGKDFDPAAVDGIATNVLVEDASPVDALVAGAGRADLLVVGNRGLHGVRALGSVSERVAHQAPCSVLLVRRPAS